jgi:hypothetical protein
MLVIHDMSKGSPGRHPAIISNLLHRLHTSPEDQYLCRAGSRVFVNRLHLAKPPLTLLLAKNCSEGWLYVQGEDQNFGIEKLSDIYLITYKKAP